ncbi:MAG: tetratricopeptide repeat protein, partial [Deltaproteobacteria bacterium]|nr:tetratricopeptide repeat protein [Deltaproteobacteria bacterium]
TDLPAPVGAADLPAPRERIDLPTTAGASDLPAPIGNIDLPTTAGASDLPAPRRFNDLPTTVGASDLPAPRVDRDLRDVFRGSSHRLANDSFSGSVDADLIGADADPFGEIGISDGADPFSAVDKASLPPIEAIRPSVSPFAHTSDSGSGDFDLPPASQDPFDEEFTPVADSIFSSPPTPASLASAKKTITGPGGVAGRPSAAGPAIGPDDFDIPSPADLTSIAPGPPSIAGQSIPVSPNASMDDFGNIDLEGDITGGIPISRRPSIGAQAGSTDFGQLDLGTGDVEETDEFDAFPVQEEDSTGPTATPGSETLDLDDAPTRAALSDDAFGGLPDKSSGKTESTGLKEPQKEKGSFEGRRKFERQSRRTKAIMLLLLLLVGAGGGALHFTPLGVFGVNALVELLPSATADEQVTNTFGTVMKALDRDTYHDINRAIEEVKRSSSELPQNEDLRIIGVYLHSWHQLRFNISQEHEKTALALLGNIKLETSESQYAPIARYARMILAGKSQMVVKTLSAVPNQSSNDAALLVMAYLQQNDPDGALQTAHKSVRKRATPRFKYLVAVAQYRLNQNEEAIATLDELVENVPNHFDARLLKARILTRNNEKDSQKVTALLNPINEADTTYASNEQKAAVHSIVGQLLYQRRKFDEAKKEFFKAQSLNPKDALMLTGNGALALLTGDLPRAITSFRAALREEPDNIEAQLGVANTLIQQDKTSEAQNIIDPVMQQNPNNAMAHYLSGVIAQGVAQYDTALSSYQRAIELNREFIEAYVAMATVYMATERNVDAMKVLDKASAEIPGSALIKLTLADSHAENEDYSSAIINLNEALALEPENPIVHFKMAQMYRQMKELEDAQNALDEVARIDPTFPGLSVEQGYLMELSGKIDDALKRYEDALKKNPEDLSAKTRVAAASIYQNNLDRAKELLVEVLNENPDSPDGNFYMGEVFRLEQSGADAIPYLKRATELDTANPMYFVRYGAALAMINDFGKALQQYNRALELDPKMAEIYLRTGEMKLRSGAVQTAITQFSRALELNPDIENAYVLIGQGYEEIADLKSAAAAYLKATKAAPGSPEGYYRLGKVTLQLKGNSAAISPLSTAIRLAKKLAPMPYWVPDAYYYLGSSQKATGDRRGAIDSFRKYLEIAEEDAIDRAEVKASLDDLIY